MNMPEKPKPGDWRMIVHVLAHGQVRPYADSVYRYLVLFEECSYIRKGPANSTPPNDTFDASKWGEAVVLPRLKAIRHWYDKPENPFQPKLDYIRNVGPGLWEFQVTEIYND